MNARLHPTLAAAMLAMAPPSSVVHQIVSEDRALHADLDYLNKLNDGTFDRRRNEAALRAQIERQGVTGGVL